MRLIKNKTKYYTYDWKTNKNKEITEESYIKIQKDFKEVKND